MSTKKKTQHVIRNSSGGWAVKKSGSERVTRNFERQKDAIDWGREIAKNQGTEFYIHRSDGRIRSKDSYGHDPCPPKDKN